MPPTATSIPPTATPVPNPTPTPVTLAAPGEVATTFGEITSQALAGNLLGDPTTRKYYILLPPDYAASDKRYPVVYVLHWYTGDAVSLVADFQRALQHSARRGRRAGDDPRLS